MNLFRSHRKAGRKPHFWSQFLLGMLAILSLPGNANLASNQQSYDSAYQQSQQLEQRQPVAPQFYQQQQQQIRLQQQISRALPQQIPLSQQPLPQNPLAALPPIRAGPHLQPTI